MRDLDQYCQTLPSLSTVSTSSRGHNGDQLSSSACFVWFKAQKGQTATKVIKLPQEMPQASLTKTLSITCVWASQYLRV